MTNPSRRHDLRTELTDSALRALDGAPNDDLRAQRGALSLSHVSTAAPARGHEEPFITRFRQIAGEQRLHVAVTFGDESLRYGELADRAEWLARRLLAAGVRREVTVAVSLLPSLHTPVAMLAIWMAGGVYLPLDPSYPAQVTERILEESAPLLLLTDAASRPRALPSTLPIIDLDASDEASRSTLPLPSVQLDQPCYILYTSGTTGRPKGVVATQRNLSHYLGVARARFGFGPEDVFCSLARHTFSISFFELLSPLACGGELKLLPRETVLDPTRLLAILEQVTVLHAGPSFLSMLLRFLDARADARTFDSVRHASSGGDMVPASVLESMKSRFPCAELFVLYGCTEISCMGTLLEIARDRPVMPSRVGRPFAGGTVRVLDEALEMVPTGTVGEVYFAGEGVARRYLARPELTSERFVCVDGQRFYRTGDLGRMHEDHGLELLGRRDFQVQVRGMRVELAGIEHTVVEHALAAQCAVVADVREADDVRLVAFVVDPAERDLSALRRRMATLLPEVMVPQAVIALPALPLTAHGKLDRLRLQALAKEGAAASLPRGEDPRTATEVTVRDAYAQVLGISTYGLGRDDDFFDRGGHSLLAVLLTTELENQLGLALAPTLVFEHTTIRTLAEAVHAASHDEQRPVLLTRSESGPALFLLLGVHIYRELARALEGQYAVYGVYAASELALLDDPSGGPSVPELASSYVSMIRKQQPTGPYRLGGLSFGGIVAWEVARQLEQAGEEVESLILLDSTLPERPLARLRRLSALSPSLLCRELFGALRERARGLSTSSPSIAPGGERTLLDLEARRQGSYRAAALGYAASAEPRQGPVTLVVSSERLAEHPLEDPQCGFGQLAPHRSTHHFAASHLGLLQAPVVTQLAQQLACALRPDPRRVCLVPSPVERALSQVA